MKEGEASLPFEGEASAPSKGEASAPSKGVSFDNSEHHSYRKTTGKFANLQTASHREKVKEEHIRSAIFPWGAFYKSWWGFTVFWAFLTFFFETYMIAFGTARSYSRGDAASVLEYIINIMFIIDILISFNLAYYDENDEIVYDRAKIAKHYLKGTFWVDLVGLLPFYAFALACAGALDEDNSLTQYLGLLRLFRLVRLYRVKELFAALQYSTQVSLLSLTLIRNFSFSMIWTHFGACVIYFISRQYDFSEDRTWIGGSISGLNGFERYLTSLYWAITSYTTVGYGDYSPVNSAEQIWGMIFMLINMVVAAWVIGSITLLIVKSDENTGAYRETLQVLDQYSEMHEFDRPLKKRLKTQLKLDFNNREISDEQVLSHFPSSVRRKVLRRLYLPSLSNTMLMRGIRQQFVDAFLGACSVEIFSPGEEVLQRGSISSELYLLVEGSVKLFSLGGGGGPLETEEGPISATASTADSELKDSLGSVKIKNAGDFINEIGFFTETPQTDTVRTVSICKTLTMTKSAYKQIAEDHPGSAGKILQNLLEKVEKQAEEVGAPPQINLPKQLHLLRAGSIFDTGDTEGSSHEADVQRTVEAIQTESAISSVKDLITMHINKQKDDHTTRFLFAASRGDIPTISLMCEQGFDPNSADYDSRTALMVSAMKGNSDAVLKLLDFSANPNMVDMHGTSALYEAAKNGHEGTMEVLLKHGAKLCMSESTSASTLCQAVFDGDIVTLRRLLFAGIQVNAGDYDKRTAMHIAGSEGNVAALKVLVEYGADLTLRDRWNNTVYDEARKVNAGKLLEYLKTVKK